MAMNKVGIWVDHISYVLSIYSGHLMLGKAGIA